MPTTVTLFLFVICMWHSAYSANYKEGETANWSFHYHGEVNMSFDIRLGDNELFYSRGVMTGNGLSSSQAQRFHVEVTEGEDTKVILTIFDVSREDSGTYTCEMNINSEIQHRLIQNYDLHVQLPLDNSSCHSVCNVMGINGNMRLIECKASLDEEEGEIKCYQQGLRSLPFTYPAQNSTILSQKFWIINVVPLLCCFSSMTRPKVVDNCTDFYWNPKSDRAGRISSKFLPCPKKKTVYLDGRNDDKRVEECKRAPSGNGSMNNEDADSPRNPNSKENISFTENSNPQSCDQTTSLIFQSITVAIVTIHLFSYLILVKDFKGLLKTSSSRKSKNYDVDYTSISGNPREEKVHDESE